MSRHDGLYESFWSPTLPTGQDEASQRALEKTLRFAAYEGAQALVRGLLAAGVDINAQSPTGRTALHHAVWGRDEDTVMYLIQLPGINANIPDKEGCIPLHYAFAEKSERPSENKDLDTAAVVRLLSRRSNIHHKNSKGESCLELLTRHIPNSEENADIYTAMALQGSCVTPARVSGHRMTMWTNGQEVTVPLSTFESDPNGVFESMTGGDEPDVLEFKFA